MQIICYKTYTKLLLKVHTVCLKKIYRYFGNVIIERYFLVQVYVVNI